jgi:succinyl-CoA synthetase beta subunit
VAQLRQAEPSTVADGPPVDLSDLTGAGEGALAEFESSLVVERYGVEVAARRRAASPEEAAAAATELGFPVVVKVDGVAHKASAGGVALGIESAEAAAAAAERLGGRVLVARQASPGPEAFAGMSRDPDYGPVLAVGLGGAAVEALSLAACALAPIGIDRARALVRQAPGLARIAGEVALETLARAVTALGRIAVEHPEVAEIDVNPFVLGVDGAVAVDALVVVDRKGTA